VRTDTSAGFRCMTSCRESTPVGQGP
jgi:hypothetical protein